MSSCGTWASTKRPKVRVLLLNQYFPPDEAPTGVLLAEVGDTLREAGHEVELLDARQPYRAGQAAAKRLRREIAALGRILLAGLRVRRPDVIVSGTSPPLLLLVATVLKLRFRARSIHWAMDLYPDLAIALDEVPPGALAALLEGLMAWCYRRTELTVALDADMAARVDALGARTECLRPWVSATMWGQAREAQTSGQGVSAGEPWTWIYSGNLGRAHEWETLLEAQQLLEGEGASIRLVFQGGGPGWAAARARAEELGLRGVEWRPYVEEDALVASLLACQVCAATQKPEIAGMLWPSKLALLLTLPRPLLFIGPPEGAIASELRRLSHAGVFAPGDVDGVAAWVQKQQREGRPVPSGAVLDGGAHRAASLARWRAWIEQAK